MRKNEEMKTWNTKPSKWKPYGDIGQRKTFTDATGQRVTALVAKNQGGELQGEYRLDFYEAGLAVIVQLGGALTSIQEGMDYVDAYLAKVSA